MSQVRGIPIAVTILSCLLGWAPAVAAPLAAGSGKQTVDLNGTPITVFTYRPAGCSDPSLLLVFHGSARDASTYRDAARVLADRHCMLLVAPLFDEQAFPGWRYQRGGIVKNGVIQDPRHWSGRLVLDLVDWTRKQEGRPLSYSLLGHSAGAQFLDRLAAFVPTEAKRIVVANPGSMYFRALRSTHRMGSARSTRERRAKRSCGATWNSRSRSISAKTIPARMTTIRPRSPKAHHATSVV